MRHVELGRLPGLAMLVIGLTLQLSGCGSGVEDASLANEIAATVNDAFTAERNAPTVSPNVLSNDITSQHSVVGLRITAYTQGTRGAVLSNGDGTFTYTPDPNKDAGADSFTYTVVDEKGTSKSGRVDVTLQAGWTTPRRLLPTADSLSAIRRYTFENGRLLYIWQQSGTTSSPSGIEFRVLWMKEYIPGTGWTDAKPFINSVTGWWSDQSQFNGDVVLVTNITSASATDAARPTSALYSMRYSANSGWEKNKVKISGETIATTISTPCLVSAQASGGGAVVACVQRDGTSQKNTVYATYCTFSVAGQSCAWSPYQSIDISKNNGETDSGLVRFVNDANGRVTLIWQVAETSGRYYFYTQTYTATTSWIAVNPRIDKVAEPTDGDATQLQSIVDSAGNIHLTWVRTNQLYAARITWGQNEQRNVSTATRLDNGSLVAGSVRLVIDEQGSVIEAWAQKEPNSAAGATTPVNYIFAARWYKDQTGAWVQGPTANRETKTDIDGDTSLLAFQASTLVWSKSYTDGTQKLWAARFKQGTLGPQVLLAATPNNLAGLLEPSASSPVVINEAGDLVWTYLRKVSLNGFFGRDLYALRIPSDWAGWLPLPPPTTGQPAATVPPLPASQLLTSLQTNFDPSVSRQVRVDAKNNIFVTWSQNDGYYNHFYASRFDAQTNAWDTASTQLDDATTFSSYTSPINAWRIVSNTQGVYTTWVARNRANLFLATRTYLNGKWQDNTQRFDIDETFAGGGLTLDSIIVRPQSIPVMFFHYSTPGMPEMGNPESYTAIYTSSYH